MIIFSVLPSHDLPHLGLCLTLLTLTGPDLAWCHSHGVPHCAAPLLGQQDRSCHPKVPTALAPQGGAGSHCTLMVSKMQLLFVK